MRPLNVLQLHDLVSAEVGELYVASRLETF